MSFGWVTLVATPKSHPFEEKRIKLNCFGVEIGRAFGRIQAASDNAIFDCKVVSVNHAVLWFQEGEFWLSDRISSNWTFVNGEKLQLDRYEPNADVRRVFSGDIIQLGVEIVKNKGFSLFHQLLERNIRYTSSEYSLSASSESLEAEHSILPNNDNPDEEKEELLKIIDEKPKFEAMMIEENGETRSQFRDLELSLEVAEQTCQQMQSRNHDLEMALYDTAEMYDSKVSELELTSTELHEKQKQLSSCEDMVKYLENKNNELSNSSVINETASELSRRLAKAINSGSCIDAEELDELTG